MARLKAATRKKMPAKEFGIPSTRGFPMNDRLHARLAIGGATHAARVGNISAATADRIKAEARAKLGIKKKPKKK
jgi:hypothetical protein